MNTLIPPPLKELASAISRPLYVVGGSVRDFLAGYSATLTDWDICSPASETEVETAAEQCGFHVNAVYRNTGTVKLTDRDGTGYEFTRFRSDKYVRGLHTPAEIEFTDDIGRDARRRDFVPMPSIMTSPPTSSVTRSAAWRTSVRKSCAPSHLPKRFSERMG